MSFLANPSRRHFIKLFLVSGATAALADGNWFATVVAQIAPQNADSPGILRLNISDFPALANSSGSIRMGTSAVLASQPRGLFYPVIITRDTGNQFFALNAECTHEGCVVPTYNASLKSMTCPCHGSRYGIDGRRISGPASFALRQYKTTFDGVNKLTIEVPDMAFNVAVASVTTGNSPRVRLDFLAFVNIQYEVLFRETLAQDWSVVPFATAADTVADKMFLPGSDDNVSVFVDRKTETGFLSVAMRAKTV